MERVFNKNCRVILSIILVLTIIGIAGNSFAASKAKVELNTSSATIAMGDKVTLKPTVSNGKATKITWKSSKPKIASVTSNGVVTGLKKGSSTITCSVKLSTGKTVKATCKVKVEEPKITVKSDLFGEHKDGQTYSHEDVLGSCAIKFTTTVKPENYNSQVKYEVFEKDGSKAKYATIDKNGMLKIDNRLGILKIKVSVKGVSKVFFINITPNSRYDYLPVGTKIKPKNNNVRIEYSYSKGCFKNYGSYIQAVKTGTSDLDIYGQKGNESFYCIRVFNNTKGFSRKVKTITVNGSYLNFDRLLK